MSDPIYVEVTTPTPIVVTLTEAVVVLPGGGSGADIAAGHTAGEATMSRLDATSNAQAGSASGTLWLGFFTASRDRTISTIRFVSGAAIIVSPSLIRFGLFSVDGSGNLTLVAATPTDLTLFGVAATIYDKAVSVPVDIVAGQRYAIGRLALQAASSGSLPGVSLGSGVLNAAAPRFVGQVTGLSDLPASVAAGSIADTTVAYYAEVF